MVVGSNPHSLTQFWVFITYNSQPNSFRVWVPLTSTLLACPPARGARLLACSAVACLRTTAVKLCAVSLAVSRHNLLDLYSLLLAIKLLLNWDSFLSFFRLASMGLHCSRIWPLFFPLAVVVVVPCCCSISISGRKLCYFVCIQYRVYVSPLYSLHAILRFLCFPPSIFGVDFSNVCSCADCRYHSWEDSSLSDPACAHPWTLCRETRRWVSGRKGKGKRASGKIWSVFSISETTSRRLCLVTALVPGCVFSLGSILILSVPGFSLLLAIGCAPYNPLLSLSLSPAYQFHVLVGSRIRWWSFSLYTFPHSNFTNPDPLATFFGGFCVCMWKPRLDSTFPLGPLWSTEVYTLFDHAAKWRREQEGRKEGRVLPQKKLIEPWQPV